MVTFRPVEGQSHLPGIPIVQEAVERSNPEWSSRGQNSATYGVREQRHSEFVELIIWSVYNNIILAR